jgi:hypothetical protein
VFDQEPQQAFVGAERSAVDAQGASLPDRRRVCPHNLERRLEKLFRRWFQTPDRIPAEEMAAKIETMVKPVFLSAHK